MSDGIGKVVAVRDVETGFVKAIGALSENPSAVGKIGAYLEHSNLAATVTIETAKTLGQVVSGKPVDSALANTAGRVGTDTVAGAIVGVSLL